MNMALEPGNLQYIDEVPAALAASPEARVIAVTSGKGGVGKTNVSVNLAIALAQLGRRVVVWDLDLGLANVNVLLNLQPDTDLSHVLDGDKNIDEVMLNAPGNIRIVPGASGDDSLANLGERKRRALLRAIAQMSRQADYIILDTGAGISAATIDFTTAADDVLVVATPEPTAIIDAYATIKVVHNAARDSRIHLLMNMANDATDARNAVLRLASAASYFLHSVLSDHRYILRDSAVGDAVRKRRPFMLSDPDCQPARTLRSLAEAIDGLPPVTLLERERSPGFLSRLMLQFGLA